jgi:hypothetical protein
MLRYIYFYRLLEPEPNLLEDISAHLNDDGDISGDGADTQTLKCSRLESTAIRDSSHFDDTQETENADYNSLFQLPTACGRIVPSKIYYEHWNLYELCTIRTNKQ